MKKTIGFITALIMMLSLTPCAFADGLVLAEGENELAIEGTLEFGLLVSDWAREEVEAAVAIDLVPSKMIGENLTKNVTRAEFAAIAVKLYENLTGSKTAGNAENAFVDIEIGTPYYSDIVNANFLGITNGTSETTFSPDALITREQMATMIVRALNSAQISTVTESVLSFADGNNISEYAKDAVRFMSDKGIIKGVGDNKFAPKATATREQAILIAYRCANEFKEDTSKATLGNILKAEFEKIANSGNALQIAEKLAANDCVNMLSMGAMSVEQGFLAGFDNTEITGFSDGAMFAPMIGTIPFVGYVFNVDNPEYAKAFADMLESSANPRWNICTRADETVVATSGNKVFFVMCPASLEN